MKDDFPVKRKPHPIEETCSLIVRLKDETIQDQWNPQIRSIINTGMTTVFPSFQADQMLSRTTLKGKLNWVGLPVTNDSTKRLNDNMCVIIIEFE